MRIGRMSRHTEQKIVAAAEKLADLVETESIDPTEALTKVASGSDFTPSQIRLIAHAYNNGRTICQRDSEGSVWDKSASFPLADADTAISQVFPKAPETPAKEYRKSAVATDYYRPPHWYRRNREAEQIHLAETALRRAWGLPDRQKAAAVTNKGMAASRGVPAKKQTRAKKRRPRRRRTLSAREVAEKRRRVMQLEREIKYAADRFFDALHRYEPGPRTFWRLVAPISTDKRILSAYEKKSHNAIPEQLWKKAARETELVASDKSPFKQWHELYRLEREVMPLREDYIFAKHAWRRARAQQYLTSLGSDAPRSPLLATLDDSSEKQATNAAVNAAAIPTVKTIAGPVPAAITGAILTNQSSQEAAKSQAPNTGVRDVISKLDTTDLMEARQRIKLQAMLHDLMLNDEVIRAYDPYDVALAFNEIQQTIPKIVEKPALLRTALRKKLEQPALDAFDLKTIGHVADPKTDKDK